MNLFILSDELATSVRYHCDKHVIKMPLEAVQILSTVAHELGFETPYKPTHKNHPVVKWAAESRINYQYVACYAFHLFREFLLRRHKYHKSQEAYFELMKILPQILGKLPDKEFENFVQCVPDEYKDTDPVKAYRKYYKAEKKHLYSWTYRDKPYWA